MKKVLHIVNGEFYAGAERVQDLLAIQLPKFGYECAFVCLKAGVFDTHRRSSVPLYTVEMKSKFDVSIIKRIARIAKEGHFAAIHTHTPRSALIGRLVAFRLNLPFFHHVHSPAGRDTENKFRNVINAALERFVVFPAAKHLVAVSSSLRNYLIDKGVIEEKITVVPNGVPVIREQPAWRKPEKYWVIGTVALFRPRKGLEILLQAMKMLLTAGIEVRLHAVGTFETPQYEAQIKKLANDLSLDQFITWAGFTKDVHSEFEKMSIFVLPSLFGEGLPMVVIEAMSVGIPVVASSVEGIPEVISSSEIGVIVEPNSAAALSAGIKNLIDNEAAIPSIVLNALARQREVFSDVAMASQLSEIYRKSIV